MSERTPSAETVATLSRKYSLLYEREQFYRMPEWQIVALLGHEPPEFARSRWQKHGTTILFCIGIAVFVVGTIIRVWH